MKAYIEIDMNNAAFQNDDGDAEPPGANGAECARILRELADWLDGQQITDDTSRALFDLNGNRVGLFRGEGETD